eukprot:764515-Hanusia_phi.AAC.3
MKTRSVLLSGRLLCGGAQQACCPWRVQTGTLQVPCLVQAKWIRSNGLACHFSLLVHSSQLVPGTSQRCSVACAKSGQAGHQELARARLYHSTKVVAHEARRVKEAVRGNEKNDQGKSDDEANHREALNVTYLGLGKNIILCVGKGVTFSPLSCSPPPTPPTPRPPVPFFVFLSLSRPPPNNLHCSLHPPCALLSLIHLSSSLLILPFPPVPAT